jgi:hypothetical protein
MDKFFDIIKKLRVPAQQGKISRQAAIDALMHGSQGSVKTLPLELQIIYLKQLLKEVLLLFLKQK